MNWTVEQLQEFLARTGQAPAKPKRKNKYNAKKARVDGLCFDSKKEAEYYNELKFRARAGDIAGFLYHGKMIVAEGVDGQAGVTYEPDFVVLNNDNTYEIIDTKGVETQVFKTKIKVLRNRYPNVEIKTV